MRELFVIPGIDAAKQHEKAQNLANGGVSTIVHMHGQGKTCVDECKVYTGRIY